MTEDYQADKKVSLNLASTDMSTTSVIDAFTKQAKHEDWTYLELNHVLDEATRRDYDHLISTLTAHCKSN